MPLLLNDNPNPQAVMLGQQHLCKVMLGGDVVWQKYRKKTSTQDLSLESLEHQGVKLKAANQNGRLSFPMFFPPLKTSDWRWYLDRLTFIGDTALSLQSIDAMLEADVVDCDMLFPMFFFDGTPPKEYDFRKKLTFMAKKTGLLELESMDGFLIADVKNGKDMYYPMWFPDEMPKRAELLNKLTFMAKGDEIDPDLNPDFVKDFTIDFYDTGHGGPDNVHDPEKDFVKDFEINVIEPTKDFIKDFEILFYDTGHGGPY